MSAQHLSTAPHAPTAAAPVHQTRKFAFIDALRGYAVLLVIVCHSGGMFHDLPYPVKRLSNFGWHGVQLFFLISCVTLLLSWRSDERKGQANALAFLTRRFFRIAPAYYLAAALYYLVMPPATGFNATQLLTTATFLNAWSPAWIPTTGDRWMVVPGGWSIGVEFSFYFAFPVIARQVRGVRGAMLCLAGAVGAAQILNASLLPLLSAKYGATATNNFLYFWFPHQLPVFAMGILLHLAILTVWNRPASPAVAWFSRHASVVFLLGIAACIFIIHLPLPGEMPASPPLFVPELYAASVVFGIMTVALAAARKSIFVNPLIQALGRVSFSAYLVHWGVLHKLPVLLPHIFFTNATGVSAIFAFLLLLSATLAITYGLAALTYRWVEEPMIAVGRSIADGITGRMLAKRSRVNEYREAA